VKWCVYWRLSSSVGRYNSILSSRYRKITIIIRFVFSSRKRITSKVHLSQTDWVIKIQLYLWTKIMKEMIKPNTFYDWWRWLTKKKITHKKLFWAQKLITMRRAREIATRWFRVTKRDNKLWPLGSRIRRSEIHRDLDCHSSKFCLFICSCHHCPERHWTSH